MTNREIVLEAVAHRETDVVPYTISIDKEVREKLDEYYGGKEKFPEHEAFMAGYGYDYLDELLPDNRFRDEFGVIWQRGEIFHMIEPALKEPTLKGYKFPTLTKDKDIPMLEKWCEDNADQFRTYTFSLLFFERSWAMRGMENILMDMVIEPAFVHELFDKLMELHLEAIDKIIDLPFDAIRFGDDFGGQKGLIMGLPYWRKYIKPRLKIMYRKVRESGKILSIHSCGDNSEILGEMIDMGLQFFNPAQPEANDLCAIKKKFGNDLAFEGGIGTQFTLPFGTPEEIEKEIRECRNILGKKGGLVMTTTKPIRKDIPLKNAAAAVNAIISEAQKGSPLN